MMEYPEAQTELIDPGNPVNNLQLLTPEEVADILKVDPSHVRRMAREGKIPHVKFGKSMRFRVTDVDEFIRVNFHGC